MTQAHHTHNKRPWAGHLNKDWDTEILELDPSPPRDSPDKSGSPPLKSRRQALAEKQAASPDSSTGSWAEVIMVPGASQNLHHGGAPSEWSVPPRSIDPLDS